MPGGDAGPGGAARVQQKMAGWLKKYPGSGVVMLGDMNWDRTSKLYAALRAGHRQDADATRIGEHRQDADATGGWRA